MLEASSNAWLLHDQLAPLVASVTVAHPLGVKLIAPARVKTDGRDTIKLARLLAANLIPAVWAPPTRSVSSWPWLPIAGASCSNRSRRATASMPCSTATI